MTEDEPDYLAQNGEDLTIEQRNAWFIERAADARKEGAAIVRFSVHEDIPHLFLVEGWKTVTAHMGRQNWQLVAG